MHAHSWEIRQIHTLIYVLVWIRSMADSSRGDDSKQDDGSGAFVFTDTNYDSTLEQVSALDYAASRHMMMMTMMPRGCMPADTHTHTHKHTHVIT